MADLGIAYLAYTKIAHAYLGKNARARVPALAIYYLFQQFKPELVKLVAQQQVQQKHLTYTVGYEHQFYEQIKHH